MSLANLDGEYCRVVRTEALIAELNAALNDYAEDKSIRAVVIAAEGVAFSAGHDLKELIAHRSDADTGRAYFAKLMGDCSAMMQAIVHHPKPVVAAGLTRPRW